MAARIVGKRERPGQWPRDAPDGARFVCFVRHAQALHNVCNDNLWTADNPLTPAGEDMCRNLRKEWAKDVFGSADLVVVSPMMRALQTAYHLNGKVGPDPRWVVSPMCAEHLSGATCDEGRPKQKLLEEIPWVCGCSGIEELEEEWWKAPRPEERLRVAAFLKFLADRPEQKIVVVSHGAFLEYVTGFYMQNTDHHIMSIEDLRRSREKMHRSTFNLCEGLNKEYANHSLRELLKAPLSCFQGMGHRRASIIGDRGPKTVSALGRWKFARFAEALCTLAPLEREGVRDVHMRECGININKALNKEWEGVAVSELLSAPLSAFEGLSQHHDTTFRSVGVRSIKDLGTWKYFLWAKSICALSEVESPDGSS